MLVTNALLHDVTGLAFVLIYPGGVASTNFIAASYGGSDKVDFPRTLNPLGVAPLRYASLQTNIEFTPLTKLLYSIS